MAKSKPKVPGLGKSKGLTFQPLDEGDYLLETLNAEWTESKNGNEMLVLEHQVLDGDEQESGSSPAGKKVWNRLVITDHQFTIDKLKNALDAHGVKITTNDTFDEKEFMGQKVTARLSVDTYENDNGETRETNRVDFYYQE